MSAADFNEKVDKFCNIILKKSDASQNDIRQNDEFWEQRNKAIIDLTALVQKFEESPQCKVSDAFNPNVFKKLKDPIKSMISDGRSQQVRDTCIFLTTLSSRAGDLTRALLRKLSLPFPITADGISISN
jgi:ABC-type taurine transport system substrate-binding protein